MEEKLWEAARTGKEAEMRELFRENPSFNVNYADEAGSTLLDYVAGFGHDAVLSFLLVHPDINVNLKCRGSTPLMMAVRAGRTSAVELLLRDSRVNTIEGDPNVPFLFTALHGNLKMIKWWIAYDREMGMSVDDALHSARAMRYKVVISLLEKFKADPVKTRSDLRKELGVADGQDPPLNLIS